jgi:two-component system sensor histidine kinase KdpD
MIDRRQVVGWVIWLIMLALATTVLLWVRGSVDQAHVALTMLLVVLGGSATGGRALGFTLAALCIILINFFFQSPIDHFTVSKPLDWIVLVNFLATAFVTTELLTRARQTAALREAQKAKDEIFAAVSHDLRTPLTTIKVLAQSGASRGEPSSIAIVEQADRLARMVGDLLELSMLRTGGLSRSPELNTADDLVGAALRQAEGMLNGRRIDVQLDFESPALVGRFDFVHTLRIVGNLLDNALRHTPEGGVVELCAERNDRWLVFSVKDRGAGVASDEQHRIFEAFYRPADATPDVGHPGLGLSIARSLADLQGGTVSYHARVGGGSIFELRLPAADVGDMGPSD